VPHEGLGTVADALARAGLAYRYLDVAKKPLRFPPFRSIAGLIVMGGPMGVYEQERYPFLKREIAFIGEAIAAKKPVLGICLGAQLIARALGARVFPNRRKEIGWYKVRLTSAGKRDPLFLNSPAQPWVFQWHGDTFTLPKGARLLAASPLCRNQAFRHGSSVYGLQFHLEVDRPMIFNWLAQPGSDAELASLGPKARRKINNGLAARLPGLSRLATPAFDAFARLCRP
jgi:GMP synthase (glutamine-hydrolysing)